MLRWQIQNRIVAIPKSVHKERIIENFNIWGLQLDQGDMAAITAMDLKRSNNAEDMKHLKGCYTMGAAIGKGWNSI